MLFHCTSILSDCSLKKSVDEYLVKSQKNYPFRVKKHLISDDFVSFFLLMIYSMGSAGQKCVISAFLELVKNSSTEKLELTKGHICDIL